MTLAVVVALIIVIQMGIAAVLSHVAHEVADLIEVMDIMTNICDAQFEVDQKKRERIEKLEQDLGYLAESSGQRLGNLENKVTLLERQARND